LKKIGSRILYDKPTKDELVVEITPFMEQKSFLMLKLWTLAYSLCGLVILSSFLFHEFKNSQEVLLVVIFLLFWGYFEFKVLYAIQWNRKGKEIITMKDGVFSYVKQLSKRGIPLEMKIDKMKPFGMIEDTEGGFWNEINNSTFIVGGEVIEYMSDESIKRLGIKLSKKDGSQLVTLLNKTAQF
tara:strand:+ start:223 stop:774 length:552 start_codon:yes stop_codon:yes gene_type:complete